MLYQALLSPLVPHSYQAQRSRAEAQRSVWLLLRVSAAYRVCVCVCVSGETSPCRRQAESSRSLTHTRTLALVCVAGSRSLACSFEERSLACVCGSEWLKRQRTPLHTRDDRKLSIQPPVACGGPINPTHSPIHSHALAS